MADLPAIRFCQKGSLPMPLGATSPQPRNYYSPGVLHEPVPPKGA